MLNTKHVRFYGRVQGVSFRASVRSQALKLGLGGWVRNCLGGTVEAVIQGEHAPLTAFLAWVESGPGMAQIEKMEIREEENQEKFSEFNVRATK